MQHVRTVLCLFIVSAVSVVALSAQPAAAPSSPRTQLTNGAIIEMVKAGFSKDLIQTAITENRPQFSFDPSSLMTLKNAGVSDEIIQAMVARQRAAGGPAPVEAPAVVSPAIPKSQPVTSASAATNGSAKPQLITSARSQESQSIDYIEKGSNEIVLNGSAVATHTGGGFAGQVSMGYLRYVTKWLGVGPMADLQFANKGGGHTLVFGGGVQFVPRLANRVYLCAGTGAGLADMSYSDLHFAATAYVGPRIFLAPHVAYDIQYGLLYVRAGGVPFKASSLSSVATGFSFIF